MPEPGPMRGCPPPPEARATLETWDWPPMNRWGFQHVREILPTVRVHRGDGPRSALPESLRDLDDLGFTRWEGGETCIRDWLDTSFTDGFIVLHRGAIVFERYMNGMDLQTLHLSQSVAKSVTGALAAILIGRGVLDPDAPLTGLIPEFRGTGYDGATLRHVMDMQSGVTFSEDYTDRDCDCGTLERVCGWKPSRPDDPACVFDLARSLARGRDHGGAFEYRSIETDVIGFCIERATGARIADLIGREIWDPLGVDEDACFTVDRAGFACVDGGFNATLRDYARFGEMLTGNGAVNGRQIVPTAFLDETRRIEDARYHTVDSATTPEGAYRNTFWKEHRETPVLICLGIFGQLIYSDPVHALTAVKLSSWPEPVSDPRKADTLRAIHTIRDAL